MPSLITKIFLFLSGYFPLFLILTIKYFKKLKLFSLIPSGIGLLSVVWLIVFLIWISKGSKNRINILSIQRKDVDVIAYIFTYILPFLSIDVSDISNLVGLGIFFFVLLILYINSNLIYINPMLNMCGFHIYEITSGANSSAVLITRKSRLIRGSTLSVATVSDDIFLEV